MDIIELCFINGIQGRRRSRALATERGFAGKACFFCKNLVSFVL
jgi:hypothetical protein